MSEPIKAAAQGASPVKESGIAYAVRIGKPHQASLGLLYLILGVCVVLLFWAAIAEVEDLTRAEGRVIPSARLQMIQNPEGGEVREIHVKQGQTVEKGDLIVSLSPIHVGGAFESRKAKFLALSAWAARLEAEAAGTALPAFPAEVRRVGADYVAAKTAEFASWRARHEIERPVIDPQIMQRVKEAEYTHVSLSTIGRILKTACDEHAIVACLVERGLEPRLELVRLEGRVGEREGKRESARLAIPRLKAASQEVRSRREATRRQYRTEAAAELSKTIADVKAQQKFLPVLADKVDRTELRSPMRGILNWLFVATVDEVAMPGEPLAEIVPADDQLVIEARIAPKDIGFVRVEQAARDKLTAYDYAIFGSMEGVVTQIPPDAVQVDERRTFDLALVETRIAVLEVVGKQLPLMPGMQTQADLITGSMTLFNYFTTPLVAMKENAFRAR